jgi:predicted phosphodiesterase
MKALVFSDVHGNLPALELVMKDCGRVDQYISLGDVIGYGPWQDECIDLISSLKNVILLEGNHERSYLAGRYESVNISQKFFDFCFPKFSRFEAIKDLRQSYRLKNFTFEHTLEHRNIYPNSEINLDENYVIGHSHVQFMLKQNGYLLCNVGSVGQNREYINIINYALIDSDDMSFDLRSVKYDIQVVIDKMQQLNYPQECIDYYIDKPQKL